MKANNGTGNIPERDEWETDQKLWNKLNAQYHFTLDCCANDGNTKCRNFTGDFCVSGFDILPRMIWMNPPFSKAQEMFETFFKVVQEGVAIFRCDNMETKVWQEIILKKADWIFIPKGRINYKGMEGKGARFPSALIGVGIDPPKDMEGVCLIEMYGVNQL